MNEAWAVEGLNYWENDSCPRSYLERALRDLVMFVEGVEIDESDVRGLTDDALREKVGFYEYVADK